MDPQKAEIIDNKQVAANIFRLKLRPYAAGPGPRPGMFFMIRVGNTKDPLLRRPMSWLAAEKTEEGEDAHLFLYEVRGRGTELLASRRPGKTVDYIGPLGNGWRLDRVPGKVIMVAGGMGAAPLQAAAGMLSQRGGRPELVFIYGARTGECLVLRDDILASGCRAMVCTEDGCAGERGVATDLLARALDDAGSEALVLSCGPRPMLKKVAAMTAEAGIPCQVSLEARMACGMGACLTCSVRGADGKNMRVCREGPVFDAKDIDWEALDDGP